MSDPTHTTSEQIARERGWRSVWLRPDPNDPEGGGKGYWNVPGSTKPQHLPDFEHDWNYNGPLQDELWAAGFDLSHDNVDGTFYWYKLNEYGTPLDDDREDTTDLKKATALDWLAWKKEG